MGILYRPVCKHDENYAFPGYFQFMLRVNGCWPTDGDENSRWFRIRDRLYTYWFFVPFLCFTIVMSAEMAYFFANITDVSKAVATMSDALVAVTVYFRMLHMRWHMPQMKEMLRVFVDRIWVNRKAHPHVFARCVRNTMPNFYLSIPLWLVLILYITYPIVVLLTTDQTLESTDKGLPYLMIFPYDQQKGWNYIVTYIMAAYSGFVTISQFYAMDALLVMIISFLSGQFELLHADIVRLVPECHAEWLRIYGGGDHKFIPEANVGHLQDMYVKRLEELCAYHNNLISFCKQLEKFFSIPLAINFGTSTFQICFLAFQFLLSSRDSIAVVLKFFLFFLSVTGQLFVVCDMGSLLIQRSTDTARYLFMCNWEGGRISKNSPLFVKQRDMDLDMLSAKLPLWYCINYYPTGKDFQSKLRFMIMRSHRPVQLSAMKFTVLSLESFSRILSSSMSYFTLLKSVLDKQN